MTVNKMLDILMDITIPLITFFIGFTLVYILLFGC